MIENPTIEQLKTLRGIVYFFKNKIDSKYYIGNTMGTFKRRYGVNRWWSLSNLYLKRAVEKHGQENFLIGILEHGITDIAILNEREIFYTKLYNSMFPFGYNFTEGGGNCGKQHPITIENKSRTFTFVDKDGHVVTFKNLNKFCRDNDLERTCMTSVFHGRQKYHRGWMQYKENLENLSFNKECLLYIIKSPNGEVINICNLAEFCKKNDLNMSNMYDLINGRRPPYKGYSLVKNLINPSRKPKEYRDRGKTGEFIDPTGEKITIHNMEKFCLKNGLNANCLRMVRLGITKQHKGYKNADPNKWTETQLQKKRNYAGAAPDSSPSVCSEMTE